LDWSKGQFLRPWERKRDAGAKGMEEAEAVRIDTEEWEIKSCGRSSY
jgi:hypothetical protein